MNKTDTIKWLEDNDIIQLYKEVDYNEIHYEEFLKKLSTYLERYANEVNRTLQALILHGYTELSLKLKPELDTIFTESFKEYLMSGEAEVQIPKEFFEEHPLSTWYKNHFGIQKASEGRIQ